VNEKYKLKANKNHTNLGFKLGDFVWLHLRKERFPSGRKNKLMVREDGTYEVVQKARENAYKVELSRDIQISI